MLFEPSLKKNKKISKNIDSRSLIIFQKNLKKDTNVKITNLLNNKSIIAKVGSKANYPEFYNSVISERIYNELEIDLVEPYVEIIALNNNSVFLANKAKMFDEEKKVANKAPVTSININEISISTPEIKIKSTPEIKVKKKKPSYIIEIAEFYFLKSAETVKNRFEKEANLENIKINKISKTRFKVYSGPHASFNSAKDTYFSLNELGFENLNITNINK